MRQIILILSFSMLAALLFALQFSAAPVILRVNESNATIDFGTKETVVLLPVENVSGRGLSARITLELVDTEDKVRGRGERLEKLSSGRESVRVPLSFNFMGLDWSERKKLPFYRLRYSVYAGEGTDARVNVAEGVISLSEITSDLFELRISAPGKGREGTRYRVRVQATHPLTRRPVSNVQLEAEVELERGDKNQIRIKAAGATDKDGQAALDFNLPAKVSEEEAKVHVTGRLKVFEQEAEATFEFDRTARLLLSSDKTLYQPGQTLHLRALVFGPNERALPSTTATFTVDDPEGTTVFRATSATTRFGVATADWQIPESTPLGDYMIYVKLEEGRFEDSRDAQYVKISRYDLPNFTVNTKPDRAYYLPGQNAKVEVRADYLFGEPVKRGRVRLVRETERRWDFKEQKWETEEGETIEGELDSEGRFIARINFQKEHERLASESYSRFSDLTYAAYLTDATTNRTEQRRFDLRLTKEPIHIYVTEGDYNQAHGMPLAFYVSASYADGTPAQCEVAAEIGEYKGNTAHYYAGYAPPPEALKKGAPFAVVTTNRYGLAKVLGPPATGKIETQRYLSVRLSARDRKGLTGHHDEGLWIDGDSDLRVETNKTIYGAGEPVRAVITSNKRDGIVFVEVTSAGRVLRSEAVRLEEGRASITFPYGREFDGRLSVVASFYEQQKNVYTNSYASGEVSGRRSILYPRDRELKLDVQLGQTTYRPGEDAEATLSAKAADGSALESVFGIVIFDKAVAERARTDREFGSTYGFYDYFHYFRYGNGEVGGITMRDLERLDVKRKPATADLSLVAELLLYSASYYDNDRVSYETDSFEKNQEAVFGGRLRERLRGVKEALDERYEKTVEYPSDNESFRRFLREAQIDFDALRDPWSMAYRTVFSAEREHDVAVIMSAGPDKAFGTRDDFRVLSFSRPYFRTLGERIDKAVNDYHARTKGFIRDEATLRSELARAGIGPAALLDRWGEPYRFEFGSKGVLHSMRVRSGGPDKRFAAQDHYGSDDFIIWTTYVDSFRDDRDALSGALNSYQEATGKFPQDEASFRESLKRAGIERDQLRDPFGRIYIASFKSESRYVDRVAVQGRFNAGGTQDNRTVIAPVNERIYIVTLFSTGEDARAGTSDDFNVATFISPTWEQTASRQEGKDSKSLTPFKGATGSITGTVVDVTGAVIPGANVKAVNVHSSDEYSAETNDSGVYVIRNLPPGLYNVIMTTRGFQILTIIDVIVRSMALTKVDATLTAGTVSEMVTVTSGAAPTINTTDSSVSNQVRELPAKVRPGQLSTPRLREYFPETLVWQPSLETDKDGRAQLRFKLADNITTWKMSVIGSTASGEIGTAEREIRAFQPFFVEHDPPRILTEGDEIALPVVLRNYLDREQRVALEIKPEDWFSLTGASTRRAEVRASDAAREVFNFRATASVSDGKQRITAIGEDASDAIEKPVTVHPDGQQRAETDSRIFSDRTSLETVIPPEAIGGSLRGELKIYTNLIGHVIEGIEAIMARPYGCGEQTISSTYPSLLVLKAYKRSGIKPPEKIEARAARYLRSGYERLLNYRAASGGISYWGGSSEANVALTAYALRFLDDARELIDVDEDVIDEARQWLIKQQQPDGSWPAYTYGDGTKDAQIAMTTALVARTLARSGKESAKTAASGTQNGKALHDALLLALGFLDRRVEQVDEPYLIASYALAALDAGDHERAARAVARLRRLTQQEGDGSYWSLESSTPFYGWGLAGRIETTALVLQALSRQSKSVDEETDALISRGLLFLLKRKDRYGVWHSTQATVNVLDAMIALLSNSSSSQADKAGSTASLIVNSKTVATIQLPPAGQLSGPLHYDLSKFLTPGRNRVEIARAGSGGPLLSAQVVTNYYLPWAKALAAETQQSKASTLRLSVSFDKTELGVTNEVTCRVKAERLSYNGYGMMLAEIGLPPGADVDRASLERAIKESNWAFTRYDLLPDRLVVYLWPRTGGTAFEFKFRPRFGINALTAPSVLYDYYNPEAQATLAPVRFVVR